MRETQLIRKISSDLQYLILALGVAQNDCVNRRHRQMMTKTRKSFRARPDSPIQTQLSTYLQANGLGNLETLDLSDSSINNDDLEWISSHFPRLVSLDLSNTKITDAGLAHLVSLKKLASLNLWIPRITSAGLPHLGKIQSLTSLGLGDTQITDESLAHLASS